jgi:hypothetical protein
MAGQTIIDQLIIKLGLDPRDFTKGEKQVAAEVLKTEQQVKRSSDGMGRSITGLAAKWLTVGAAIAAIKKVVSVIDDVAQRTRQLGIDSQNYNVAAAKLRNLENAVEMVGGSAEDSRKTVAGFQKAVFDLAYNGTVSDSLVMLARLGVQFQTATGDARDFTDVVLDTADVIDQRIKNGSMSRANAYQFLLQAGFDSGTANLILQGRAQAQAELNAQATRRQVNADDIAKATDIRRASISKDQALETVGIRGMDTAGGIQKGVNQFIEKLSSGDASQALGMLTKGAHDAGTALEDWALKSSGTTRGLRNNNPGNLKAVGNQLRDREGFAVFSSMDEGVRRANHQLELYRQRGIKTANDIINTWAPKKDKNNVAAYLDDIKRDTGIAPDMEVKPEDYAMFLAAIFKHESGKNAPDMQDVVDVLTMQDGGDVLGSNTAVPTPSAAGATINKTDVRIDSIEVVTQAKDADRMASDLDGALSRKLMASHAETGVQ